MVRAIVHTADTCSGSPRIDGTRLTCANVVTLLLRLGLRDFLWTHNYLERADVEACLDYCSREICLQDSPESFCEGCTHDRTPGEDPTAFASDLSDIGGCEQSDQGYVYLGTPEDYEADGPFDCWKLAADLKKSDRPGK